eukprot:XP_017951421.1 PREDICTED: uncharacterized protein LOC101733395 isoform X1 [Xenopus tropicalis]
MDPSSEREEPVPVTAEAADILEPEQTAKRRIKPSVKRIETYEAQKDEINDGLSDLWNKTDHCITIADEAGNTRLQLTDALIRLKTAYFNYKRLAEKNSSFLSNARMEEALQELNAFTIIDQQRQITFLQATSRMETRIAQLQDNASKASTSSRRSKGLSRSLHSVLQKSSLSSQIIRARAEAEAAKVQAQCIKREAALKAHIARNQAETKAQLEVLQKEREEAAAIAKLNVLEQAFEEEEAEVYRPCLTTPADPVMRTLQFVLDQEVRKTTFPTIEDAAYSSPVHRTEDPVFRSREAQTAELTNPHTCQTKESSEPAYATGHTLRDEGETKLTPGFSMRQPSSSPKPKSLSDLNPSATPFPPPHQLCVLATAPKVEVPEVTADIKTEGTEMSEFAKYMIRRELLNTGLTEFDDRPEHYRSWRATFRAAIKNLDIEPMGELDLLIKWLGPKSSEQARLLKSVNIEAPARGLIQVWERLERDYGSPEVIERTLLNRFYNFPSFSSKGNRKLQELSDFLLELETAKLDPHLPGLCCLDTAYGLYPITEKLPQYLKDKWNMVGAEYKSLHQVLFPPFSFFCGFIRKMARVKNDPSFLPPDQSHSTTEPATWDIARRRKDLRKTVSVRKTGFSSSKPIATPELRKGKPTDLDPNLSCPIHNKPHPLRKCCVFREKPFEERKTFLKDHYICYRCCASSEHFAKDCKAIIKFSECNSDKHVTANHSRPSRQAPSNGDSHNPSLNYGGESAEEQTNPVSTKCTEVCGKELCRRSCAKICLVKVAPVGHPEKAVKMYVILDDQSNRSLASPKFFKHFKIQSEAHPYTLRTCAGQIRENSLWISDSTY